MTCELLAGTDGIPAVLKPPKTETRLQTLHATGTQVYECRVSRNDPHRMEWVFIEPEAELRNENGRRMGRHGEGPRWQSTDGSEVIGALRVSLPAPQEDALPWQLLATQSIGPNGAFSKVTSIQRINTVGGLPPETTFCTPRLAGTRAIVPYEADYVMFCDR